MNRKQRRQAKLAPIPTSEQIFGDTIFEEMMAGFVIDDSKVYQVGPMKIWGEQMRWLIAAGYMSPSGFTIAPINDIALYLLERGMKLKLLDDDITEEISETNANSNADETSLSNNKNIGINVMRYPNAQYISNL